MCMRLRAGEAEIRACLRKGLRVAVQLPVPMSTIPL